jgi:tetratricopeptide (TPR) repeat protein
MATLEEVLNAYASATRRYLTGDLSGAIEELDEVEKLAHSVNDDVLVVGILTNKAGYLREMGRTDESRKVLAEASDKFAKLPTRQRDIALTSLYLEKGIVAKNAGDMTLAENFLRQAADEARKHADDGRITSLSDILANLATVYQNQGRLKDAQDALLEAVSFDRKIGNLRALSNDLNTLASIYEIMGDRVTQELYLQNALQQALKGGFIKEAADAMANLATIAELEGRLDEAQEAYQHALEIYVQIGNMWEAANAKSSLGIVAAQKGDLAKAQQLHEEAYQLHLQVGHIVFSVNDLLNLAQVTLAMGQPENAFAYALKAVEQAEKFGLVEILWAAHWLVAITRSSRLTEDLDPNQAGKILNDEVLPRYAKAADAIELLRTGIGRSEEREYILGNKEDLYAQAIFLSGTLSQPLNAFIFSERARARAFLDVMGQPESSVKQLRIL